MSQTTTQTKVSPEQQKHGGPKQEGESCGTKGTKQGSEKEGSCGSSSGQKGSCG